MDGCHPDIADKAKCDIASDSCQRKAVTDQSSPGVATHATTMLQDSIYLTIVEHCKDGICVDCGMHNRLSVALGFDVTVSSGSSCRSQPRERNMVGTW